MHRYYTTQELNDAAMKLKEKSIEIYKLLKQELY